MGDGITAGTRQEEGSDPADERVIAPDWFIGGRGVDVAALAVAVDATLAVAGDAAIAVADNAGGDLDAGIIIKKNDGRKWRRAYLTFLSALAGRGLEVH